MYKKLQELKESSKLTNQQIAELSGVPLSTVNRILSGQTDNPTFATVCDMVKAMGGSLDELYGLETSHREDGTNDNRLIQAYIEMINQRDKVIREKNKWIKVLFICTACLVAVFVGIALFDIFNPNVGYVRY